MDIQKFFIFTLKIFYITYLFFLSIKFYFFLLLFILIASFIIYFEIIKFDSNVIYSEIVLTKNKTNELVDFFQEFLGRFIFNIIRLYITIRDNGLSNFKKQYTKKVLLLYIVILILIIITKIKILLIYIYYCYINVPGQSEDLFESFKQIFFTSLFNNPILDIFNSEIIIFAGNGVFSYKTCSLRSYNI